MSKPSDQPPAYPDYPPHQQQSGASNFQSQPPPPGGYYPPPPQPQVYPPGPGGYPGVIVAPPVVFREFPVAMVCQHCHASINTQVTMDTGVLPWLVCGGLFLIGCSLGCCLIPFCIDGLKDAIHTCPQCRKVVGQYKRM